MSRVVLAGCGCLRLVVTVGTDLGNACVLHVHALDESLVTKTLRSSRFPAHLLDGRYVCCSIGRSTTSVTSACKLSRMAVVDSITCGM